MQPTRNNSHKLKEATHKYRNRPNQTTTHNVANYVRHDLRATYATKVDSDWALTRNKVAHAGWASWARSLPKSDMPDALKERCATGILKGLPEATWADIRQPYRAMGTM